MKKDGPKPSVDSSMHGSLLSCHKYGLPFTLFPSSSIFLTHFDLIRISTSVFDKTRYHQLPDSLNSLIRYINPSNLVFLYQTYLPQKYNHHDVASAVKSALDRLSFTITPLRGESTSFFKDGAISFKGDLYDHRRQRQFNS